MNTAQSKRVLDVGQCIPDHNAIRRLIESAFAARVESAADIASALKVLCQDRFDLVLVNRILDDTAEEGIDLVRKMKDSPFLRDTPVILISNFDSAQQEAVAHGAEPGFGKADLDEPQTRTLLARYLD